MIKYRICSKCGAFTYNQSCDACGADLQYYDEDENIENAMYAVRYGYQYRKQAILNVGHRDIKLHFCLPPVNEILVWIGKAVLSGIAYDVLKMGVKRLWSKIKAKEIQVDYDKETEVILNNDDSLFEFYEYVEEYKNGFVHLTDDEFKYIYEEMIADFSSEEMCKLYTGDFIRLSKEGRIEIIKEANKRARERISKTVKRKSE